MSEQVVLLTGATGQLGRALRAALAERARVVATTRQELDLLDVDAIRRVVRAVRPDVVVNAAAWTAVDAAESRREETWRVNAIAPGVLAEEAARLGAVLVHYSTDYVFDGRATSPYREDSLTAPLGAYGASKLDGERAVWAVAGRALVLRTSWLYAADGANFFRTMVRLATTPSPDPVRVVNDQRGAPTSCGFVAAVTSCVLGDSRVRATPAGDALWGTYHVTAAGSTTWYGFAAAIFAGLAERGFAVRRLVPIGTDEYSTPAVRPAYSVLDSGKLTRVFGVAPSPWEAQLARVLDDCAPTLADALGTHEPAAAHPH